jgi:hypothetical protein
LAHVRFTPEEYRAIRALCRSIHLRDECFPIFRYFLAEALHERWPELAGRVALLEERQLRLLFRHLQKRQGRKATAGQGSEGGEARALSARELEAVARAAQLFGLCGGERSHFRAFLACYFRGEAPALLEKLARLSDRALGELYRRARRPTH